MNTAVALSGKPRFGSLKQWLTWQRQLHPREVDLGLERVTEVLRRMRLARPDCPVVTVGGTNGKGSTVVFLQAILRAAGYRVGSYTSPHILRYNERVRIDGKPVDDAELCNAFAAVDAARGDISLSFFEFGTLAALHIFQAAKIQAAVLEVGLGGRLDAVNALNADASIVTTVALDHTDWLGNDRNSIGYEKAGIFRSGKPAVCADPEPPASLLGHAREIGAQLFRIGDDFSYTRDAASWSWQSTLQRYEELPMPVLAGEHQLSNAAAALMALTTVRRQLPVGQEAVRTGIAQAFHPGRFQVLGSRPGGPEWVIDIGHNPQSAAALAETLHAHAVTGRNVAIVGMLQDKDAEGVAGCLDGIVHHWYTVPLKGTRGQTAARLGQRLHRTGIPLAAITACNSTAAACRAAEADCTDGDRVIVCGSIYTVANALRNHSLGGQVWTSS